MGATKQARRQKANAHCKPCVRRKNEWPEKRKRGDGGTEAYAAGFIAEGSFRDDDFVVFLGRGCSKPSSSTSFTCRTAVADASATAAASASAAAAAAAAAAASAAASAAAAAAASDVAAAAASDVAAAIAAAAEAAMAAWFCC